MHGFRAFGTLQRTLKGTLKGTHTETKVEEIRVPCVDTSLGLQSLRAVFRVLDLGFRFLRLKPWAPSMGPWPLALLRDLKGYT